MSDVTKKINRRNFLKVTGAAGLTTLLAGKNSAAEQNDSNAPKTVITKYPQVPTRTLGKTGAKVSVLSIGLMYNLLENQLMLYKALDWGVNYWDTAYSYVNGNSELGIGKFLKKNPDRRKEIFLISKASRTRNIEDVEKRLQTSLKRLNTNYIDLYYLHNIKGTERLTNELRDWSKSAKDRGLIRFFGFTTHANMVECLNFGAKLDWIDAIMHSYNFRLMQDENLTAAVEACHKAGIGLVAMKTQGRKSIRHLETDEDKKLTDHFLKRGFTEGQAKIKAVLADKRFGSACVGMDNVARLTENVAAVLDKTKFTPEDMAAFKKTAQATCSGYCAGCANICDNALADLPYVSDIMRYLMYYNSYGDEKIAKELFRQIPVNVRRRLTKTNYALAEARCPQNLPIAKLVSEAVDKLA